MPRSHDQQRAEHHHQDLLCVVGGVDATHLVGTIYGMNFKHIPELEWVFGYPMALGLMVVSAVLPYLYFKRKGWL